MKRLAWPLVAPLVLLAAPACKYDCEAYADDLAFEHEECELEPPEPDPSCSDDQAELYECYVECYRRATCDEILSLGEEEDDLGECLGFCDEAI